MGYFSRKPFFRTLVDLENYPSLPCLGTFENFATRLYVLSFENITMYLVFGQRETVYFLKEIEPRSSDL